MFVFNITSRYYSGFRYREAHYSGCHSSDSEQGRNSSLNTSTAESQGLEDSFSAPGTAARGGRDAVLSVGIGCLLVYFISLPFLHAKYPFSFDEFFFCAAMIMVSLVILV
jgi:hypothetical protein